MVTSTTSPDGPADRAHVAAARLYDAECALRSACQTRVEVWIAAANAKLQRAVREHLAAVAARTTKN